MPNESDQTPRPPQEAQNEPMPPIFPEPGQKWLAGIQAIIVWWLKGLGLFGIIAFLILSISILVAAFVIPIWVAQKINEKERLRPTEQHGKEEKEQPAQPGPQTLSAPGSMVVRESSLELTRFVADRHKIDQMIASDYDAAERDIALGIGLFWLGQFAGSAKQYDQAIKRCLRWVEAVDLVRFHVIEISFLRSCANWMRGRRGLAIEDCKFAETQLHDLTEALQRRDSADVKLADVKLLKERQTETCEWYESMLGDPQRKEHQDDVNN